MKVAIKRNFRKGMLSYLASFDCLSIYRLYKQQRNFVHGLFRVKNLNKMKNLKVYDPDPEKSFTKAKVARLKQEHTHLNVSVDIETVATNHISKFPTADSAFTNDFSLLPN